jgi:hypothetical protein
MAENLVRTNNLAVQAGGYHEAFTPGVYLIAYWKPEKRYYYPAAFFSDY